MKIVVADASALLEYVLVTEAGIGIQGVLHHPETDLHVPSLCDIEMAAGLRRALLLGVLSERRAAQAVEDYLDLPLVRHGHQGLLGPVLALRHNFSPYDAAYVALAEQLGAALLTADHALGRETRAHTGLTILP